MPQTKYTYSIASDTLNGAYDVKLQDEIGATAIVIAVDYISTDADVLDIFMKDALSAGDQALLTGAVNAHDGAPPPDGVSLVSFEKKTATQKLPIVALHKSEGTDFSRASHDWTKRTSWYSDSVRVTGESPGNAGLIYTLANQNVINLVSGDVSDEDEFSAAYLVKVYDGGVEMSVDDYTVDYVSGTITLDQAPAGAITVDYSYENGSTYTLKPDPGKVLFLEHSEIQFSGAVTLSPIEFQIWAYNPADLPNKIMVKKKVYKNARDILNSANLGTGKISAFGELLSDIQVFPFNYVYLQPLKDSQGLELRLKLQNDQPFTGEFATVTFYCISEDEV